MSPGHVRILILAAAFLSFVSFKSDPMRSEGEKHFELCLRQIGDGLLSKLGDTTSRILPIEYKEGLFVISFESSLSFNPEDLLLSADSILTNTDYTGPYIFEVQECNSQDVVYSFMWNKGFDAMTVACKSRALPEACYEVTVAFGRQEKNTLSSYQTYLVLSVLIVLLTLLGVYLRKQKKKSASDIDIIPLGEYRFDKRNTELIHRDKKIELTGKEAELLVLLYDAVNTTVEREVILNMVWGDQGDYVGRTLDVFISKLRKKLEADDNVKIVNIRGVGYKLVTNA